MTKVLPRSHRLELTVGASVLGTGSTELWQSLPQLSCQTLGSKTSSSCEGGRIKPTAVVVDGFPVAPYSHAVKAGNLVYLARQTGTDYRTGKISNNFETQARQAFENLSTVLRSAGSSLEMAVKTTIWLQNAEHLQTMNKLYQEYFPKNAPAKSTPIVDLPRPDLLISIEAIALSSDERPSQSLGQKEESR